MSDDNFKVRNYEVIAKQEAIHADQQIFGEFNKAWISGIIEDDFKYQENEFGGAFYETRVIVRRLSGTEDYIPILAQKFVLPNIENMSLKGKYVEIGGRFASYIKTGEDQKNHLKLYLFATTIHVYENEEEQKELKDENVIYLNGFIHKRPFYRVTTFGRRITELIIRVERDDGKIDIIPCVAWGNTADKASFLKVRDKIELYGRMQSRQYFKRYSPTTTEGEYKEAYEISIIMMRQI